MAHFLTVMLGVVKLNVVILGVIILSVVAPFFSSMFVRAIKALKTFLRPWDKKYKTFFSVNYIFQC